MRNVADTGVPLVAPATARAYSVCVLGAGASEPTGTEAAKLRSGWTVAVTGVANPGSSTLSWTWAPAGTVPAASGSETNECGLLSSGYSGDCVLRTWTMRLRSLSTEPTNWLGTAKGNVQ